MGSCPQNRKNINEFPCAVRLQTSPDGWPWAVAASGLRGERERGRKPAVEAAQVRRERHTPPSSSSSSLAHKTAPPITTTSHIAAGLPGITPFVNLLPIIAIAAIAIASEGGRRRREAEGDGEKRNWLAGSRRKHPTHFRARLSGKVTGCLFLGQSFQWVFSANVWGTGTTQLSKVDVLSGLHFPQVLGRCNRLYKLSLTKLAKPLGEYERCVSGFMSLDLYPGFLFGRRIQKSSELKRIWFGLKNYK
jgi:hypothetical protein